MQVVMWLILCATLGLAEIVTRTHGIEGAQQVHVGPVVVRLPYGWKPDRVDPFSAMQAHDPDGKRQLFVLVTPLQRGDPLIVTPEYDPNRVEFRGLGRAGIMELAHHTRDEDIETRLVAKVAVPAASVKLTVGFNIGGNEPTGPEISLLERIAAGITLAGNSPPPQIGPPDGNVVLDRGSGFREGEAPSFPLSVAGTLSVPSPLPVPASPQSAKGHGTRSAPATERVGVRGVGSAPVGFPHPSPLPDGEGGNRRFVASPSPVIALS
jgi:hypothetical protein